MPSAERSNLGVSCESPVAMNVDHGMRKDEGGMVPWLCQSVSFSSRKWLDKLQCISTSQIAMTMGQTYRAMEEAYESHPFYWEQQIIQLIKAPSFDKPGKGHEVTSGRDFMILKVFFRGASKLLFGYETQEGSMVWVHAFEYRWLRWDLEPNRAWTITYTTPLMSAIRNGTVPLSHHKLERKPTTAASAVAATLSNHFSRAENKY